MAARRLRRTPCDVLGCECGCHRVPRRQAPVLWTRAMDAVLRESLARAELPRDIAARLYLTENSVLWRIKALGLSLRDGWYSREELRGVLGVSRRAIDRWTRDGRLRMTPHGRRWTRVTDADLRSFVARFAGVLFDPSGVADADLRRLAELSAHANRRRTG